MAVKAASALELGIFLLCLIFGTACSLLSKNMLAMTSVGLSGYLHRKHDTSQRKEFPVWIYFFLIFPSLFDLIACSLFMFGLRYISASMYQMLRGGSIIFVALIKHYFMDGKLKNYQWIGIFWNVVSILLVGVIAILTSYSNLDLPDTRRITSKHQLLIQASHADLLAPPITAEYSDYPMTGFLLVLLGALTQSLQYPFEEKVMIMKTPTPPLLLIGMEGFWGAIMCVFVLYPMAYFTPGSDHGSLENPWNTWTMLKNSTEIQITFVLYIVTVFSFNLFGCLVTYMLDSLWRALLDNFRPVSVWLVDMFIYYCISYAFGEAWIPLLGWVQVLSLLILLYGTAVYNAPKPFSVRLQGQWTSCFIDCRNEYERLDHDHDSNLEMQQISNERKLELNYSSIIGNESGSEICD